MHACVDNIPLQNVSQVGNEALPVNSERKLETSLTELDTGATGGT